MSEFQINYLAVGVAALTNIFIGVIWYSPLLFGNLWAKAQGFSKEQLKETAGRAFIVSLFCYLVMAFVLALLISYTGVSMVLQGAFLGFLLWIGFLATLGLTAHTFSGKPLSIYLIDAGYQLVYVVAMGVILAAWQ